MKSETKGRADTIESTSKHGGKDKTVFTARCYEGDLKYLTVELLPEHRANITVETTKGVFANRHYTVTRNDMQLQAYRPKPGKPPKRYRVNGSIGAISPDRRHRINVYFVDDWDTGIIDVGVQESRE